MHHHLNLDDIHNFDGVIHCGDSTNNKEPHINEEQFREFASWFTSLPVKHKILIAGNHDAWATRKYNVDFIKNKGVHYLEDELVTIQNIKIYGSPRTPHYGDWYFTSAKDKIHKYWDNIQNCDILVTHGPPKGILDLSYNRQRELEFCGDGALMHAIARIQPKFHLFGHIHNSEGCYNSGICKISGLETIFVNASCVTDGKFKAGLTSQGQIISI